MAIRFARSMSLTIKFLCPKLYIPKNFSPSNLPPFGSKAKSKADAFPVQTFHAWELPKGKYPGS